MPEKITHVLYGFANINPQTGEVFSSDEYADVQKKISTDTTSDDSTQAQGCVEQLFVLKTKNRNLKTLLSIGGWSYSTNLAGAVGSEAKRKTFVNTSVQLMQDWGLDGLDIDWEVGLL